jgi:hypothetical protein
MVGPVVVVVASAPQLLALVMVVHKIETQVQPIKLPVVEFPAMDFLEGLVLGPVSLQI